MSYRKVIGIAGFLVLGCAAGGYYWMRERNAGLERTWASARAADSRSAPTTDFPAIAPTGPASTSTPDKPAIQR